MASLGSKIDIVLDTLGEVKVTVTEIKDELRQKVDLKDHKLLEKRVSVLETGTQS